jgi:predicted RNase H-like nuclease (RuvC/YqgF family)
MEEAKASAQFASFGAGYKGLSFGGESRVVFTVHAPREEILISPSKGGDTQIRIVGRRLEKIVYQPLIRKPQHLIVGIDPGATLGIVALDFDGNLVYLESTRLTSSQNMRGLENR